MKLIAQADVVLALGTRLGPFGTLPQHGLDYWPKNAKIIQVDADPRMLGLVKQISVGICGDAKAAAQGAASPARPTASSRAPRTREHGCKTIKAREGRVGSRARRLDAREGPVVARGREGLAATCIRARCCASWRRRCRRTPWCRPTSATSARSSTATCASSGRARCSPR